MTNEQLVLRIRAGENTAANMLQLWQQNQGLIGKIAGRYRHYADEEDLKQEGYFGLCAAVEHWEPERSAAFSTALFQYVRSAMLRYIQNNGVVRIPVHAMERVTEYDRFVRAFRQQAGRKPSDGEICHYLGVSDKQLQSIRKSAEMAKLASLDVPVGDDAEVTIGDLIADQTDVEGSVLDDVQKEELKAVIWPLVDGLRDIQSKVVRMRYQEGLTLKETGEWLGCTLNNAREHERNAFRELRRPSRARKLRPFLEDDIRSRGMQGTGVTCFNETWTSATERVALVSIGRYYNATEKVR